MLYSIIFLIFLFAPLIGQAVTLNSLSSLEKMKPGETKQIKLTLINEKDQAEQVELKLCNYSCNCEGQHFYEEASKHTRSNLSWVSTNETRLTLEAGKSRDVYLTIQVPNDSALKGSYWSIVLVEPVDSLPFNGKAEKGFRLNVKVRFAYHIVVNIDEGIATLKVVKKDFKVIDGKKYLVIDVANTGELFLNPKLIVKLYNQKGGLETTLEGQSERLYPGLSQRYQLDIQSVIPQKYTAFLLLDNGDKHLFGDTVELVIPVH